MNHPSGGRMKGTFGWVLLIAFVAILFLLIKPSGSTQYASIPLSEFASRLESDRVRTVVVQNDELRGEFAGDETVGTDRVRKFRVLLPAGTTSNWAFNQWLLNNRRGASVTVDSNQNLLLNIFVPLIPWLLIFAFVWYFVFRNLRRFQTVDPNAPRPVYIVPPPPGAMTTAMPASAS